LIRRVVAEQAKCPPEAVRFVSPLRHRGKTARGSEFLVPKILRSLVTFPSNHRRPDLAVVLIDEDGDRSRQSLGAALEASVVPAVIGLACPEFEAWLIADHAALCAALRIAVDPSPETMAPRAAKAFLASALSRAGIPEGGSDSVRRQLASICNLQMLQRLRTFELFQKELGRLLAR
jgi:hypothetical protein